MRQKLLNQYANRIQIELIRALPAAAFQSTAMRLNIMQLRGNACDSQLLTFGAVCNCCLRNELTVTSSRTLPTHMTSV